MSLAGSQAPVVYSSMRDVGGQRPQSPIRKTKQLKEVGSQSDMIDETSSVQLRRLAEAESLVSNLQLQLDEERGENAHLKARLEEALNDLAIAHQNIETATLDIEARRESQRLAELLCRAEEKIEGLREEIASREASAKKEAGLAQREEIVALKNELLEKQKAAFEVEAALTRRLAAAEAEARDFERQVSEAYATQNAQVTRFTEVSRENERVYLKNEEALKTRIKELSNQLKELTESVEKGQLANNKDSELEDRIASLSAALQEKEKQVLETRNAFALILDNGVRQVTAKLRRISQGESPYTSPVEPSPMDLSDAGFEARIKTFFAERKAADKLVDLIFHQRLESEDAHSAELAALNEENASLKQALQDRSNSVVPSMPRFEHSIKDIILSRMDAEAMTRDTDEMIPGERPELQDHLPHQEEEEEDLDENDCLKSEILQPAFSSKTSTEDMAKFESQKKALEEALELKKKAAGKYKRLYFLSSIRLIGCLSELERLKGIKVKAL